MTSPMRIAVVSGANKSIGFAVVRQLALQYPSSKFNNGPLLIYLTARDQGRGEKAVQQLQEDAQLKKAKALVSDGGLSTIKYRQLDISDKQSIDDLADYLKKEHGQIDVLINNAGIAMQGFDSNIVKETLHCNYYGTLEATERILPLIRDGGRLVNVASMSGKLGKYSPELRKRFLNASTTDDSTALMKEFASSVEAGDHKEKGWISAAYAVSKAGVIAMTRAVASREQSKGSKVLINACCPGYVVTDMTRGGGVKQPDEGAQTPVMLGIGDIAGKTGEFWQDEKLFQWDA